MAARTILQIVGSPQDDFFRELSELYARGSVEALGGEGYDFRFLHASPTPDGRGEWRMPGDLSPASIRTARAMDLGTAISHVQAMPIACALPQMFCRAGMTDCRALLDLIGLPFIGNTALAMGIAADKAMAKALVAQAGVSVPRGVLVREGDPLPDLSAPVVVKPNASDNSAGLTLVEPGDDLAAAIAHAQAGGHDALVEEFVRLGREMRAGVLEQADGSLTVLPLEEYSVDPQTRPVRRAQDKLARNDDGDLQLMAKTDSESWIVPDGDPAFDAVANAARTAHKALNMRHYSLFDFRIDPRGKPWFLEASPYCSFAPGSVLVTQARAAGIDLPQLFARLLDVAVTPSNSATERAA